MLKGKAVKSVLDTLLHWGEHRSSGVAYTELDGKGAVYGSLTYQELIRRIRSRASWITQHGLRGERIVLALPSGLEFVVSFYACLYAGAVPVMVEPLRRPRSFNHLRAVLRDCSPKLLISESEQQVGVEWKCPAELEADAHSEAEPSRRELAYLQYTSGSTGTPRGVIVTHANILANNEVIKQVCQQPQGATLVSWLPVYHDMGLVSKVLQALYLGGHCVLMNPSTFLWKPSLWLKAISDYQAHTTGSPNFGYELALRKVSEDDCLGLDLSCLHTAFCAAEPVRMKTMQSFGKRFAPYGFQEEAFKPAYGLAEFTLCATLAGSRRKRAYLCVDRNALSEGVVREQSDGSPYVNCGSPADGTSVSIVSEDNGEILPEDRVGEILLDGPSRTEGHWGDIPSRGPLHTGDLGFLHQGELYIVGRKKDLIILDGRNVYPEDIERTVEGADPLIGPGSSVALSLDDGRREVLVIGLESRRGDKGALEAAVREAVAREHDVAVSEVFFVAPGGLPRTSSGKIKRRACAELLNESRPESKSVTETTASTLDPVERFLCTRLAILAGLPSVEPDVAFERLGIASVHRFSLMGELAQAIGIPVAGDATWTYPTSRALATALREKTTGGLEIFNLGTGAPMVLVPSVSGGVSWARDLRDYLPENLTVITVRQPPQAFSSLEDFAGYIVGKLTERYPEGPFSLVGYSQYCRLAYEVARQLTEKGLEVNLLAAIDGSLYEWQRLPLWEYWRQFWNRLLWQALGVFSVQGISGVVKGFKGTWSNLRRILAARKDPMPGLHEIGPEAPSSPNRETMSLNLELATHYRPRPMDGDILVFRVPSNNFSGMFMRDAGWGEAVRGKVEVVDIEGTHTSILTPPTVRRIAEKIVDGLSRREGYATLEIHERSRTEWPG